MDLPSPSSTSEGYRPSQIRNVEHYGKGTDIVILVIGPTGAGKSTFINEVINEERLTVSGRMKPCTTQPCSVVIDPIPGFPNLEGHRLVLVDTPGFNNDDLDDTEILKRISRWLEKSHAGDMSLGGVVYLHDISLKTFTEADRRNLNTVWRLCRDATTIHKTILATTRWGPPTPEGSENREKELKIEHWRTMIDSGAKVHRFLRDSTSAWNIIIDLLQDFGPPRTGSGGSATGQMRSILGTKLSRSRRGKIPAGCVVQ